MKVGKTYRAVPVFTYGNDSALHGQAMRGTCVWVHPKGRFAVLEFRFRSGAVRECFRAGEIGG